MQDSIIEDNTLLDSVITDKGIKVKDGEKLIGSSLYPLVVMKKEYL
ncbi:glucose-1-phosphate adenylyltransferase, GlgD subunit [Clostridioides difficile]|nr:glucose-1-phosphate adenylyltransferase, GlgD subunit [Clostridioides difficile]